MSHLDVHIEYRRVETWRVELDVVRPGRKVQVLERPVEIIDDPNVEAIDKHGCLPLCDVNAHTAMALQLGGHAPGRREDESIRVVGIAIAVVWVGTERKSDRRNRSRRRARTDRDTCRALAAHTIVGNQAVWGFGGVGRGTACPGGVGGFLFCAVPDEGAGDVRFLAVDSADSGKAPSDPSLPALLPTRASP